MDNFEKFFKDAETKTKYQLQKRITELEAELLISDNNLSIYRCISMDIYNTLCELITEGKTINQGWILKQLKRAMR